jgi:glutamyl-tRNA reductase
LLGTYDVIFSATSASSYVITSEKFKQSLASSGTQRKQVLIDLALPRDIDPALRTFPDVVLVDVDDLRQGLDRSLEFRKQAIPAVLAIIDEEVARWQAQQRELSMRPVVVKLRQHAEEIRRQEVARTMRFLGPVDAETQEHIHHLSRALVNKLLHEPTIRIKELAHTDDADAYASAICDLFGLHNHHQNGHHNGNGEQDVTAETGKDVGLASGSESDLEIEPEIDIVEEHAKFSGEAARP